MLLPKIMLERVSRNYPGKKAYRCGAVSRTWAEMNQRADRLAAGLMSLGARRGDCVAILGQESLEIYEHYFACMKAGLVRVGINWRYAPAEIAHILKDCAVKVVLVEQQCISQLSAALALVDLPIEVVVYGRGDAHVMGYEHLLARSTPIASIELHDSEPLVISYTSGSTGVPKGVVHSHRSVALIIMQGAISRGLTTDDVWYAATASSWMACVLNMIGLANGMTTIITDGAFEIDAFIEETQRHQITTALLVPTIIGRLVDRCGATPEVLSSLRLLMYGSSPASVGLIERVLGTFRWRLMQTYGMTEGGWVSHLTPADHELGLKGRSELLRSAGRVGGMYQMSIRDEEGTELPSGQAGEVWLRGETTMLRYHNRPSETEEALADGWLHTNDIGRFDEEGYLYLLDRKKFLIITGAVNVFPASVEAVLSRHPAVREIAVVGAPHPDWGEAVVAVVSQRPGHPAPTTAQLGAFAASQLSRMELPKHVMTMEELPKTVTGKIDKRAIKDWVDSQREKLPWAHAALHAEPAE